MSEMTKETSGAYSNRWVKRDMDAMRLKIEQLQAELETYKDLYRQASDEVSIQFKFYSKEADKVKLLQSKLDSLRWIPTDDSPLDDIDWDEKVHVLECESKVPIIMTMAGIFLDEGSEAEYWKPIILPKCEHNFGANHICQTCGIAECHLEDET